MKDASKDSCCDKVHVGGSEVVFTGAYTRVLDGGAPLLTVGDDGSRPVYRNANGKFLFYRPTSDDWIIGDDYQAQGGVFASQPPSSKHKCPADSHAWRTVSNGTIDASADSEAQAVVKCVAMTPGEAQYLPLTDLWFDKWNGGTVPTQDDVLSVTKAAQDSGWIDDETCLIVVRVFYFNANYQLFGLVRIETIVDGDHIKGDHRLSCQSSMSGYHASLACASSASRP